MTKPVARPALPLQYAFAVLVLLLGACATVSCGFDAVAQAMLSKSQFLQHQDSRTASR